MTWISLVCLLVVSSATLSRAVPAGYGGYDSSATRMANIFTGTHLNDMSSGLLQETRLASPYGSSLVSVPLTRTLTVPNYGGMTRSLEFDSTPLPTLPVVQPTLPAPEPLPLTQADILCRGQRPETVIPIDNNRRFVVCLDDTKGVVQDCPKGLLYHEGSRRCERRLGPSDNLCASQPCFNGGQCLPTDSWFQCQCAPGFEGPTCELDARVCQTQNPCGSAAGVRCQSFRLGAALSWVCLFDDETSYGPSSSQIIAGPCQDHDGPQSLAYTNKGFLMCDGLRMFVESCPGGTIWDKLNKACVWPDMEIDSSLVINERRLEDLSSGYGSGYGQTRTLISKPTYGGYGSERTLIRPKHIHTGYGGYGAEKTLVVPKFIESGYGAEKTLVVPKFIESGYGGEKTIIRPKFIESGYGGEKVLDRTINTGSYGGYGAEKHFVPKVIESGYGGEKLIERKINTGSYGGYGAEKHFVPKVIESGYGGEKVLERTIDTGSFGGYGAEKHFVPKVIESGYGGEKLIERKINTGSYGGYGAEKHFVPKVMESGYGQTFVAPKLIESGYGGEKTLIRPKHIESGYGGQQEEMISVNKVAGGY